MKFLLCRASDYFTKSSPTVIEIADLDSLLELARSELANSESNGLIISTFPLSYTGENELKTRLDIEFILTVYDDYLE